MAYQETIRYPGQGRVETLNGSIALEEATGRLIIRDPSTRQPRNIQDISGTHIYDEQGREMTRLDILGLSTIEPATQRHRNRVGVAATDLRAGNWTSKPGQDVRSLLGEQ